MAATIVLPGDEISPEQLPQLKKGTLTLGPGLRHIPPSAILATTAGSVVSDYKKSAVWLERHHGRYLPSVNDLVIAQVHHSGSDVYYCSLTPHTQHALLGQLAFEGANKKTRPQLRSGDVVYARVLRESKWEDVEIECFNSATGKAEGMGPLKGGMVFDVSLLFARRLMMGNNKGGVHVLDELGDKLKFEVAVGRNGKVWVDSASIKETVTIGRLLQEVDERNLDVEEQKKLVKKSLKELRG